jgi:hypothetical protein
MQRAASAAALRHQTRGYSRHERIFRDEGSIRIAAHVTAMATIAVIAKSVVHMTGPLRCSAAD